MTTLELLKDKDYLVVVKQQNSEEEAWTVTFPKTTLIHGERERVVVSYSLTTEGLSRTVTPGGKKSVLGIPRYACRLYMNLDVSMVLRELGLSTQLTVCEDDTGEVVDDIPGVVPYEELDKEAILSSLFFEALEEDFPKKYDKQAKKLRILDGYTVLKELFD
jgi:hypothetical protein